MIVKLVYTNNLDVPVLLRSNMGTGQPLLPHQNLEMTFDLAEDDDGVSDLILICEPGSG